ncbi:hypothetical protein [Sulfurimonas sp.]|uniref:hypothetical protein n=1 Tax=Sulfurimonas sp. TaxID=2022749 RepID=UPI0025F1E30D|nr:hypothetical protein [Sulfurimonas sp.]
MHAFGMGLICLVLILFVLALLYYSDMDTDNDISAKEMLDNRFARGEINSQEYKVIRDSLRL